MSPISPIRFVCGCENGHLQDIDWRWVVHQRRFGNGPGGSGQPCQNPIWLEDAGTSADPRDTRVVCDCGASLSLEELFQPKRLGQCPGERPWLNDKDPKACDARDGLRLLIRSATNTYFPQVARVISLPQTVDALTRRIDDFWSVVQGCQTLADVSAARRFNPQVKASLEGFSDEEVLARIQSMASAARTTPADTAEDPRIAEFQILASGHSLIGENSPTAHLHAETLDRDDWDERRDPLLPGIASLVAVHRLREVACLYGFTRFEPAPLEKDDLEDVGLAVAGAPLGREPNWFPAVEQFGEGFFLRLNPDALAAWLARPAVTSRLQELRSGMDAWIEAARQRGVAITGNPFQERERPEYIMAHSLAHALMSEVAIDCGYPASSLKERVYVLPRAPGEPSRCGILIYTASAGHQGTLGGLVDVTRRFDGVLKSALERELLCSGDPVCADHEPKSAQEDRTLHGAACHGCLLIAETSCEARNVFLDRALLADTVGSQGAGFFSWR